MDVEEYEVTYAMAVMALVGEENFVGGQTHGPIDKIKLKDGTSAPTEKTIQDKIKELEKEYSDNKYQRDRAPLYPAIGDQLDALYHAGVFPKEMADKIKAVKDANPKPE